MGTTTVKSPCGQLASTARAGGTSPGANSSPSNAPRTDSAQSREARREANDCVGGNSAAGLKPCKTQGLSEATGR